MSLKSSVLELVGGQAGGGSWDIIADRNGTGKNSSTQIFELIFKNQGICYSLKLNYKKNQKN